MSTRSHIATASIALGSDPAEIGTEYFTSSAGEHGVLKLSGDLSIATFGTSPAALRKIAMAALELADWREQKDAAAARLAVAS